MIQLIASGGNPPSMVLGLHVFKWSNPASLSIFPHSSCLQISHYLLLRLHHFWSPSGAITSLEQSWRTLLKVLCCFCLSMSQHNVQFCGIFDIKEPGVCLPLWISTSHSCTCTGENPCWNTEFGLFTKREEGKWQRGKKPVLSCNSFWEFQLKKAYLDSSFPNKPFSLKLAKKEGDCV